MWCDKPRDDLLMVDCVVRSALCPTFLALWYLELQWPKPRRLFDIFEIRFRKTTENTEDTEGVKEKNNNSLCPSVSSVV